MISLFSCEQSGEHVIAGFGQCARSYKKSLLLSVLCSPHLTHRDTGILISNVSKIMKFVQILAEMFDSMFIYLPELSN